MLRPTRTEPTRLADLLDGLVTFDQTALDQGVGDLTVTGIGLDSRASSAGDLYVALPGSRAHGAVFATSAQQRGAVAVLTDPAGRALVADQGDPLPVVTVDDPRAAMAEVAARLYRRPSSAMEMYGITGTNGKTTTAFLVEAALTHLGATTGTIGTIGFRIDGRPLHSGRTTVTTPESVDLQALLAVFVQEGARACVMEVSSHALALHRVDACEFDVVGFTNLGRDHLDFHADLDDYFEAKATLFAPGRSQHAVVMVDDEHGRTLAARIREAGAPAVTTVGSAEGADVRIVEHDAIPGGGSRIVLDHRGDHVEFTIDLPGEHNVRNAALALAMVAASGHPIDRAAAGLAHAQVPGRMQRIDLKRTGRPAPSVVVDFAHTPQAIAEAVRLASAFRRTAVVVGAGGDRDRAKRAPMGEAAAAVDLVVVTDDNPRTEDPAQIRAEVASGARNGRAEVREVDDRRAAIAEALAWAGPDDLVLVLGKGHETGQQVGDQVRPFDDAAVVAEVWNEIAGGGDAHP
ncbi:UDP-N-acetylmuramoyl-L-alanyl-D-glutamate--2,6-diaminopimelate ligase [Aestuariimicrobium ganziense]|uniref:UDP-N-acetylmuramoyl-L-alanyl-D-glutamate--2, 6-diaminopimelate ligase n=1 Tax=Aestuariimicrobium ganziense TaxID=2773677 RepID=UPI0019430708|nr:UDP-N-acetylmuramoyl-L-alanyl-D-glutamate--2,6-diaminopimelate ligase [Aestuariimicrobium ganziense]